MTQWTSVRVSKDTRDWLQDRQQPDESYEDVIRRLLGDSNGLAERVEQLEEHVYGGGL